MLCFFSLCLSFPAWENPTSLLTEYVCIAVEGGEVTLKLREAAKQSDEFYGCGHALELLGK